MKKWMLSFCIFNTLFCLDKNNKADVFIEDCQKYTIEPGWVIRSFLKMNSQEFDVSWHYLVAVVKKNHSFAERKMRALWQEQCHFYDQFLKDLYVTLDNKLVMRDASGVPFKSISIFEHWKIKKNKDLYDFYAFYFDRIAAEFVEVVMNIQRGNDQCAEYKRTVRGYLYRLQTIFHHLKNSDYDARYAQHLKRYQEIKDLLCKEVGEKS